jgi:hypothetical protein
MCFSVMELTSRGRLPAEHVYITETCEVYYTEKERCTVRTKQCNGKQAWYLSDYQTETCKDALGSTPSIDLQP